MSFLKELTVSSVFDKAIVDIQAIKTKQNLKSEKITKDQTRKEEEFKAASDLNAAAIKVADDEIKLADKVILNFKRLFGVEESEDETTDA